MVWQCVGMDKQMEKRFVWVGKDSISLIHTSNK